MSRPSLVSKTHQLDTKPDNTYKTLRTTPTEIYSPNAPVILLVDDDPAVLESLSHVLATEGWRVIAAPNGEVALERLADQKPDLMITDLCMMGVSGWDLLFHENLQRPDLPIFIITALPPTSVGGAEHLATAFFQKPLDLEGLVAAIRRHFREVARQLSLS